MVDDLREIPDGRHVLEIIVSELVLLFGVRIRLTIRLPFLCEIALGPRRLATDYSPGEYSLTPSNSACCFRRRI